MCVHAKILQMIMVRWQPKFNDGSMSAVAEYCQSHKPYMFVQYEPTCTMYITDQPFQFHLLLC